MSSSYRSSMRSSTRRGPPSPQSSSKRSSSQRSSNQMRTESTPLPGSLRGSTIPPSVVFAQPTSQLPPHVLHGGPKPQPRVLYVSVPPPPAANTNAYAAADVARQSYRAGDRYAQNYRSSAPKRTEPLWRRFSRSRMSLVGLILGAVGVLGGVLHVAWWIVFAVVFASGKGPSGNAQLSNYQNQYNAGTCTTDMPDGFNCGWFQSSIYGKMCCCHTSQGSSYACVANNQYVFRTTECLDKCGFNS